MLGMVVSISHKGNGGEKLEEMMRWCKGGSISESDMLGLYIGSIHRV